MISVKNLEKRFDIHVKTEGLAASLKNLIVRKTQTKWALKDISFEISPGQIVGLVGANGAGKTTLVKILSGIVYPSSGEARVLGFIPWERYTDFKKSIAVIMGQKAQLWWDLPAADCFTLLREIYQIPEDDHKKTLGELVERLGVGKELHVQIRRLSLGERMKMELIATLLHKPKVVFLDEPTIGLDLTSQKAIRNFLLDYKKDHNPIMILTSHYMEDIEALAKRVMILRQGEIVFDGPLEKIQSLYSKNKILGFRVEDSEKLKLQEELRLGKFEFFTDNDQLRVRVPKSDTRALAAKILGNYSVTDVTIEDEDVAGIIERLQTGRSGSSA